jgi:hypothetical protein
VCTRGIASFHIINLSHQDMVSSSMSIPVRVMSSQPLPCLKHHVDHLTCTTAHQTTMEVRKIGSTCSMWCFPVKTDLWADLWVGQGPGSICTVRSAASMTLADYLIRAKPNNRCKPEHRRSLPPLGRVCGVCFAAAVHANQFQLHMSKCHGTVWHSLR